MTLREEVIAILRKFEQHSRLCGDDMGKMSVSYFRVAIAVLLARLDAGETL